MIAVLLASVNGSVQMKALTSVGYKSQVSEAEPVFPPSVGFGNSACLQTVEILL